LDDLQERLGYRFTNDKLLRQALTHRSCGASNNERMEFIGDSLLNMIAAILLYEKFPALAEGNMSRCRAALVCEGTLVIISKRLGIQKFLRIDPAVHQAGAGTVQPAMLADALEAIFAAIYLDAGMAAVIRVVRAQLIDTINRSEVKFGKDPKTALQELLQGRGIALPTYSMQGIPDRNSPGSLVTANCSIPTLRILTTGRGASKKLAEADAASKAITLCQHH
jgi:ribonuclease-3